MCYTLRLAIVQVVFPFNVCFHHRFPQDSKGQYKSSSQDDLADHQTPNYGARNVEHMIMASLKSSPFVASSSSVCKMCVYIICTAALQLLLQCRLVERERNRNRFYLSINNFWILIFGFSLYAIFF